MRLSAVRDVARKEIVEALRDRNFVLNVLLMPIFLYPLLGFGAFQVWQLMAGARDQETLRVGVGPAVPAAVVDSLRTYDRFELLSPPAAFDGTAESFRAWRQAEPVDALVLWGEGDPDTARIWYDEANDRSGRAVSRVDEAIGHWERSRAEERVVAVGLGPEDLDVFAVESDDTASAEQRGQEILASVLPLILLLMMTMGSYYAALDAVVGERERGTWETILVAPLTRAEILVGKYGFVVLSSLVSLALNLFSMAFFLGFVLRLLDTNREVVVQLEPAALGLILVGATLAAALYSAIVMIVAAPAKTHREGQAALGPIYLLTMVPALSVAMSREAFSMRDALIPMLNAGALFKSALKGEFPPGPIVVTLVVLVAATAAALAIAARIVSRDDVFVSSRFSWKEIWKS